MKLAVFAVLLMLVLHASAFASEGEHANTLSLNGAWQFAFGDGDEKAELAAGQARLSWRAVTLPGEFVPWDEKLSQSIKYVWVRRSFTITAAQARGLAVLRWNQITFGATAYLNGQLVGANEPTGPYQVIVPPGVLRAGQNEIVLRVNGPLGVRRSASDHYLIPAGFASQNPGGMPLISDDVWLDFAEGGYMQWALAFPELAHGRVTFRVTTVGLRPAEGLQVAIEVKSWPAGEVAGRGVAEARVVPGAQDATMVVVPMPGFKPWTYETPNLYTASLRLLRGTQVLDEMTVRFGMREITLADGRYRLNGRSLWLRGSDLVGEWAWYDTKIAGHEKDYLVTEAREMSMNSFRTHTQPLPKLWADLCDENGTMILAEFPVLYNGSNYHFTPAEYDIFHANVLTDAQGWMARLWNHPSVVTWVISNESSSDHAWEFGPYYDFVKSFDPTRPIMRTDHETRDLVDHHACDNTVDTIEGRLFADLASYFDHADGRPVTNTEYMNLFDRPLTQWTGTTSKAADALVYAQLGMEHTEAMRRVRLAGIWPYMYAGWTRTRTPGKHWKAGFAEPISAVLHSALSPVLASLDLFNADYLAGSQVTTDLYLINDSWHDAKVHVDLLLTKGNPEAVPEAECLSHPLWRAGYDFELKSDTLTKTPVTWRLPTQPGQYWLTARTAGAPGRPVLSQRFVRAIPAPRLATPRPLHVLGQDEAWTPVAADLLSRGVTLSGSTGSLAPGDRVLIWNPAHLAPEQRPALRTFVEKGGTLVVLSADAWEWKDLCDITIPKFEPGWGNESYRYSRAFVYPGLTHPMLAGVLPESLQRWNGVPGLVAVAPLQGPALTTARKLLWVREPDHVVAADLPLGKGHLLLCQLALREHLTPDTASYDPVAEQILLNLIGS